MLKSFSVPLHDSSSSHSLHNLIMGEPSGEASKEIEFPTQNHILVEYEDGSDDDSNGSSSSEDNENSTIDQNIEVCTPTEDVVAIHPEDVPLPDDSDDEDETEEDEEQESGEEKAEDSEDITNNTRERCTFKSAAPDPKISKKSAKLIQFKDGEYKKARPSRPLTFYGNRRSCAVEESTGSMIDDDDDDDEYDGPYDWENDGGIVIESGRRRNELHDNWRNDYERRPRMHNDRRHNGNDNHRYRRGSYGMNGGYGDGIDHSRLERKYRRADSPHTNYGFITNDCMPEDALNCYRGVDRYLTEKIICTQDNCRLFKPFKMTDIEKKDNNVRCKPFTDEDIMKEQMRVNIIANIISIEGFVSIEDIWKIYKSYPKKDEYSFINMDDLSQFIKHRPHIFGFNLNKVYNFNVLASVSVQRFVHGISHQMDIDHIIDSFAPGRERRIFFKAFHITSMHANINQFFSSFPSVFVYQEGWKLCDEVYSFPSLFIPSCLPLRSSNIDQSNVMCGIGEVLTNNRFGIKLTSLCPLRVGYQYIVDVSKDIFDVPQSEYVKGMVVPYMAIRALQGDRKHAFAIGIGPPRNEHLREMSNMAIDYVDSETPIGPLFNRSKKRGSRDILNEIRMIAIRDEINVRNTIREVFKNENEEKMKEENDKNDHELIHLSLPLTYLYRQVEKLFSSKYHSFIRYLNERPFYYILSNEVDIEYIRLVSESDEIGVRNLFDLLSEGTEKGRYFKSDLPSLYSYVSLNDQSHVLNTSHLKNALIFVDNCDGKVVSSKWRYDSTYNVFLSV